MTHRIAPFAVCLVALAASVAAADPPSPSTDIQPADVAQLVEQLESREFAERQEATRQLSEAGKAAFAELEKASVAGSRETSGRALDVLKGHFQRGDNDTKSAAKATLERLATSGNSAIAQRAQTILNPPPQPNAADLANVFGAAPANRVANLQIQIAANNRPAPVAGRTESVTRSGNGGLKIQITEKRKVTKIESVPGGKIEAEITDAPNAQPRKIEAKDIEELRKKDAEIARIYEQYSQPAARIQAARPLVVPNGFRAAGPAAPLTPDAVKQRIQSLEASIAQFKAQLPNNPAVQPSIDSLERTLQRYKDMLPAEKPAATPKPVEVSEPKAVGGQ